MRRCPESIPPTEVVLFRVSVALLGVCLEILGIAMLAGGPPLLGILLMTLGIAGAYLPLREEIAFVRILREVNRRHGMHFTRANGFGIHLRIYFDPENRKLLVTDGKTSRIEDISALSSWRLKWKSRMRLGYSAPLLEDFRIQISFADQRRPDLEIRCRSKAQGEFWHARMSGIVNPSLTGQEQQA